MNDETQAPWEAWRQEQLRKDPTCGDLHTPTEMVTKAQAPATPRPQRAGDKPLRLVQAEGLGEELAKCVRAVIDPLRARVEVLEAEAKALRRELAIERQERRALARNGT